MRLKCIGGTHDGETIYIKDSQYRIGDWIRVPEKQKLLSAEEFNPASIPDKITINYDIYVISSFNFNKDDQHIFLIPKNWTDKEAILWQFNK